ncbi:hypothetical protein DEEACLCL_00192 [Salmonella phage CRW-SP2]|nr:hypothetical protein DEEACLCL_00192 [Salmonella phage CRW-SP2]
MATLFLTSKLSFDTIIAKGKIDFRCDSHYSHVRPEKLVLIAQGRNCGVLEGYAFVEAEIEYFHKDHLDNYTSCEAHVKNIKKIDKPFYVTYPDDSFHGMVR